MFSWKIRKISSKFIKNNSKKWETKITDNVFKSMRVGNLGLGTYPSQNARLLYYFLHLNIKIGPTVANQNSTWGNRELWGLAIEKWLSFLSENHEMTKNGGLYDEIDIWWDPNWAEKIDKAIKNIVWLFLYYILIKNCQKRSKMTKKCQKMPKNLWFPMISYDFLVHFSAMLWCPFDLAATRSRR